MSGPQIIKPDRDSHFLLLPCECGSTDVGYIHTSANLGAPLWRVKCNTCGKTGPPRLARHQAQIEWNGREKPSWERE